MAFTVKNLHQKPSCDWKKLVEKLMVDPIKRDIAEMSIRELDNEGIRRLLFSSYLDDRLSKRSHKTAAKNITTLHRKIRQAMLYSYPSQGLLVLY